MSTARPTRSQRRAAPGTTATLTVAIAAFLVGCGGEEPGELDDTAPATTASSPSATATDADGLTAQERAAVEAVEAYHVALRAYQRGEADDLAGTATDELADDALPTIDEQLRAKGLTVLGDVVVEPLDVDVSGDEATVVACVDSTQVFVVEEGTEEVREGATAGTRSRSRYGLRRDGDTWLVANPFSEEGASC